MSWLYSRALVAEYSEDICLDGAPCALWSGTATPQASWLPAKTTDVCRLSLSGMTFKPLTDDLGEAVLMSYRAAFHAKTLVLPERAQASTASAPVCGSTWRELWVKWSRDSSSWKTHQCLWEEVLPESSVILPRWGMMRDGELLELMQSPLPTNERDSGLWPTPQRVDYKGTTSNSTFEQRQAQFKFWTDGESLSGTIYPNPDTYDVLMGWPKGWSASNEPATDKFHKWQHSHGGY